MRHILLYPRTAAFACALILAAAMASAQEAVILPGPFSPPAFAELKIYLALRDAQVTGLNEVQRQRLEAEQAIYTEINQKQQTINQLLAAGSTDAARIGQLTIEVSQLLKKLPLGGEPYRSQSLSILTADQRAKLPALAAAMQLQTPGWQAVSLNLIDNPVSGPRVFPVDLTFGNAISATRK